MANLRLNDGYGVSRIVTLTLPTTIDGNPVTEISGFYRAEGKAGARSYTTVLGDSIKKICKGAFKETSINTINFPNCTYVGEQAFSYATRLSQAIMPKCSWIDSEAFYSCPLTSISFPECLKIGEYVFTFNSNLTSLDFPKCSYVGAGTFYGMKNLTTASFPCCSYVEAGAFASCASLRTMYFLNSSVTMLSVGGYPGEVFANCPTLSQVYVPASLVSAYKSTPCWSQYTSLITPYSD